MTRHRSTSRLNLSCSHATSADSLQLFEMQGVDETIAREAFQLAAAKLPVKTKVIKRMAM
jgi:ribosomal protein L16/L10AE